MKGIALLLAVLLLAACSGTQTAPTPAPEPIAPVVAPPPPKAPQAPVALEEYFKIPRLQFPASVRRQGLFRYDEKVVGFLSDQGGRIDLWVKPVDGGEATQITHVEGFLGLFAFSPKKDQLIYTADVGGNELPHLFLTDSSGKDPKDLSADLPAGARVAFLRWSPDGKWLWFLSSKRDPRFMDLVELEVASGKSQILWEANEKHLLGGLSDDGKQLILVELFSDVDNNLYLLERGEKKPKLLTPHLKKARFQPAAFSKDGKTLYYLSDEGAEYMALYAMELKTQKSKVVLQPNWDVEEVSFSENYKYMLTNTNVDGAPQVAVTDALKGTPVVLPAFDGPGSLVPVGTSPSDRYLAAMRVADNAPIDLFLIDMTEKKVLKLSDATPASLKNQPFVAGESVRIPSFDGKEVPAFLYKPTTGSGPFPALIDVHGGPTAQSKRRINAFNQYLVSKGFVVLVPNVRGSTGYGKTYTQLDNLDFGGGPLQDVVACKKWLVEKASVNAKKVVVLGKSYGGYMALAAATYTPLEFAANVDYFGPSDLKTLVESFPVYWSATMSVIYAKFGNPKDPEHQQYLHDRSPLNYVDKIRRPLLVVQGENDPRVRRDQSERLVEALKSKNIPVYYLFIPGEGHGFSKEANLQLASATTDRFLDRVIFGDTSVEVIKP